MEQETFQNARYLIVDDEVANIRLLEQNLEQWKCFNVESTTDPREVISLYRRFAPDLILLDLHMPYLDGFQVMEQLQAVLAEEAYLPILVLTADITPQVKRRALAAGAKDFLTKPFDATELLLRVWNLLETRFLYLELEKEKHQLQENYQRLQDLEALRDDLTHMLIHDLRTPLTAFLGGIETVAMLGELNVEQQESVNIAYEGGQTLLGMINDLLDISKMEDKSLPLEYKTLTAGDIIERALRQVGTLIIGRELSLVSDIAPGLPTFEGDEDKLVRTLVNLLSNAIKFTPTGGTVTAGAHRAADENAIVFTVSDTGEGIPQEAFARIFEKFGQVETRQAGRRMSTGLGLTFCKMVVEAHGGRIWVESELGQGSTFLFTMPCAR
ncbi:MAG: response regulator [Armatimonadota bacterium]|nr:response regulator [Armatimonadota bacterium]